MEHSKDGCPVSLVLITRNSRCKDRNVCCNLFSKNEHFNLYAGITSFGGVNSPVLAMTHAQRCNTQPVQKKK